jgi:hypothetical protein
VGRLLCFDVNLDPGKTSDRNFDRLREGQFGFVAVSMAQRVVPLRMKENTSEPASGKRGWGIARNCGFELQTFLLWRLP